MKFASTWKHLKPTLSSKPLWLAVLLLLSGTPVNANEWNIITHNDMDSNTTTSIAIIENDKGYTLEIYKDSVGAIRARFTLTQNLVRWPDDFCPTFQIDNGPARNRSINDAPCLSANTWAEFVLGYESNGHVSSRAIVGLMNGVNISFRYLLDRGYYHETRFSLRGSKRAMSAALGAGVTVSSTGPN